MDELWDCGIVRRE